MPDLYEGLDEAPAADPIFDGLEDAPTPQPGFLEEPKPTFTPDPSKTRRLADPKELDGYEPLVRSAFVASRRDPAGYSKLLEESRRSGVPVNVLEDAQGPSAKDPITIPDEQLLDLLKNNPKLTEYLSNPDNFSISRDDIENLQNLEAGGRSYSPLKSLFANVTHLPIDPYETKREGKGLTESLIYGGYQTGLSVARIPAYLYETQEALGRISPLFDPKRFLGFEPTGSENAFGFMNLLDNPLTAGLERAGEPYKSPVLEESFLKSVMSGDLEKAGEVVAHQVAVNAPNMALALVSGGLGLGQRASFFLGGLSAAAATKEGKEKGLEGPALAAYASAYGALETYFERSGTLKILEDSTKFVAERWGKEAAGDMAKNIFKVMVGAFGQEGKEEAYTEIGQYFTDVAAGVEKFSIKNLLERVAQSYVVGGVSGAGMTTPAATTAGILRSIQENAEKNAVDGQKDAFLKRGEAVKKSKTAAQSPEEFKELQAQTLKDAPNEFTYLDSTGTKEYFQAQDLDPAEFFKQIGETQAWQDGRSSGFIRVPTASLDLAASSPHYAPLADHATYDINLPTPQGLKTQQEFRDQMQKQAEEAQGKPEKTQEQDEEKAFITDVAQQLEAADMKRSEAQTTAKLLHGVSVLAKRSKKKFEDLVKQMGLKIEGIEKIKIPEAKGVFQEAEPKQALDPKVLQNLMTMYAGYVQQGGQETFEQWNKRLTRKPKERTPEQLEAETAEFNLAVERQLERDKAAWEAEGKQQAYDAWKADGGDTKDAKDFVDFAHQYILEQIANPQEPLGVDLGTGIIGGGRKTYGPGSETKDILEDPRIPDDGGILQVGPVQEQVRPGGDKGVQGTKGLLGTVAAYLRKTGLFQQDQGPLQKVAPQGEAKGRFFIDADGRYRIELSKLKDWSTAPHEFFHAYLELLRALGTEKGATSEIKEMWQTAVEELGIEGNEITPQQHEKWAESAEKYLAKGIAPSKGLARVFSRMKRWMAKLGKYLQDQGVDISSRLTALFDQILATNEEIEALQQASGFKDFLPKNMPQEAKDRVIELEKEAQALAEEILLKDMKVDTSSLEARELALEALYSDRVVEILALKGEIYRGLLAGAGRMKKGAKEAVGKGVLAEIAQNRRARAQAAARNAKEAAVEILNRLPVNQSERFEHYITQERTAAMKKAVALSKKEYAKAAMYNDQMVMNHALVAQAKKNEKAHERAFKHFEKYKGKDADIAKIRDMDLVNAGRAVLASFGIGESAKNAQQFIAPIEKYDPDRYKEIKQKIESISENAMPWNLLNHADFMNLSHAVDSIWEQAKTANEIMVDGKKHIQADAANAVIAEILAFQKKMGENPEVKQQFFRKTQEEKQGIKALGRRAASRRVESWAEMIGPETKKFIARTVLSGTNDFGVKNIEAMTKVVKSLEALKNRPDWKEKIEAPELLSKEDREAGRPSGFENFGKLLGALVHIGNGFEPGSNGYKLLVGNNWADFTPEGDILTDRWNSFLDRMVREGKVTEKEMDAVQAVWDLFEAFKPESQEAHKRRYGFYFKEITHVPLKMFGKEYAGGYVPAIYDVFEDSTAMKYQQQRQLEEGSGAYNYPSTSAGFTKERIAKYAKPLLMDLSMIPLHINEALKFIHIKPRVAEVAKLVLTGSLSETLDQLDPTLIGDMLSPWLQRAATQSAYDPASGFGGKWLDEKARYLRRNAAMQVMFGNVYNTLQQLTGFPIAAQKTISGKKIGMTRLAAAQWKRLRDPGASMESIRSDSKFMAARHDVQFDVIEREWNELNLNPTPYESLQGWAKKNAYILQIWMQSQMDAVIYLAAKETASEAGLSGPDAIFEAESAVRQTQGSGRPEDLSKIETQGGLVSALMMFFNFFNTQKNLIQTEKGKAGFSRGFKGTGHWLSTPRGLAQAAGILLVPSVLSSLLYRGMSGTGLDADDDGEYLDDLMQVFFWDTAKSTFAMYPGGNYANAIIQHLTAPESKQREGVDLRVSPVVGLLESSGKGAVSAMSLLYDGLSMAFGEGEVEGPNRYQIKDMLTLLGLVTGLPAATAAKPIGYGMDLAEGESERDGILGHLMGFLTGWSGKPKEFSDPIYDTLEEAVE